MHALFSSPEKAFAGCSWQHGTVLDRSLPTNHFFMSCHLMLSLHFSPFLICSGDACDATSELQKSLRQESLK